MKVKIRSVIDHGHADERIIFDVIDDTEIGDHLVFDTTYTSNGRISNKVRHSFWFPDQKVKRGDVVVLYTSKGTDTSSINRDNSTTWFFFWGLNSCVWNNDGDCALLMHIDEWVHHRVNV